MPPACGVDKPKACTTTGADTCCSPKLGIVILTMQWIPGYGPADGFTLHGLGPDLCDGSWGPAAGCDSRRKYPDVSVFLPPDLRKEMDTVWPSNRSPNPKFWSYEWAKHGTCVSTVEPRCFPSNSYTPGSEVVPYFRKVVELRKTYDLYPALIAAKIMPDDSLNYPLESLIDAIKSFYGVKVAFSCTADGAILEAQMQMSVQGKDEYTPMDNPAPSTCPGVVVFPVKYPSGN